MEPFGLPAALVSVLLSIAAAGGIFVAGYWLVYRPTAKLVREARERLDRQQEELTQAVEELRRSDSERREAVEEARRVLTQGVKETAVSFDRIRSATTDLVRQEIRASVEDGIAKLKQAKEDAARAAREPSYHV